MPLPDQDIPEEAERLSKRCLALAKVTGISEEEI
jgi:hypothetical protein